MIFNTFAYFFCFLVPAAILYRYCGKEHRASVCIGFGAAFFVYYSIHEVGGYAGAACLGIFLWEAIFSRLYRPGSKWCLVGVIQAILILIIFKYWNFFTGLLFPGANPLHWKGAFLPLGISFFTFEFIHYAVDRYRGTAVAGRLRDYMAFILYFPTMVAGPIKRYQSFAAGLKNPATDWGLDWNRGVTRILAGLVKKFAIADLLTAFTDHLNVHDIALAERWILPVWLLAFGFKIYFDFSAYSDIAIGSARLFGITIPENFDWPYLRTNITDFWRSWHMSLYRWLVDYVFIPLGGSQVPLPAVYRNVILTMLISGLWHGAAANFLIWGLWHGLLLAIHRFWTSFRPPTDKEPSAFGRACGWVLTFGSVNLGWAFFCMDTETAWFFLNRLFIG
ncbi:MAG TPA: MBOAT family O-acyltransferase [Verrucomicrobiae bacterium]